MTDLLLIYIYQALFPIFSAKISRDNTSINRKKYLRRDIFYN